MSHQFRETLPDGKSYLTLDRFESEADNTQVFIVPPGHYFMMGDNRDNSDDSREAVGYVPAEEPCRQGGIRILLDRWQQQSGRNSGRGPAQSATAGCSPSSTDLEARLGHVFSGREICSSAP